MEAFVVRPVQAADLPQLKVVIRDTDMFPPELLDGMIAGYLQQEDQSIWLTGEGDVPLFVAFCAPEQMTEGTWNLYLIAVHPSLQSKGYGQRIMTYLEDELRERGERVLIVETSGLPDFERTRQFYHQCGYTEEARIREFYAAGEDKVVFWKSLTA